MLKEINNEKNWLFEIKDKDDKSQIYHEDFNKFSKYINLIKKKLKDLIIIILKNL